MRLANQRLKDWPKLAWVAVCDHGKSDMVAYHGPLVEIHPDWLVEGVWDGEFTKGDFDQTELIFGTGIRIYADHVIFVSSGTVFDRLLYCQMGKRVFVSNSLPALLAVANLNLREDYPDYAQDGRSVIRGLENRVKIIPTQTADIQTVYYRNMVYRNGEIHEEDKPDTAPDFRTYEIYNQYVTDVARKLGANCSSPERAHCIGMLSSISSGYDSSVAACISRYAGCKATVTIKQANSFWRGNDSGIEIARHLGMSCKEYNKTCKNYPYEHAFWAVAGHPNILNWSQFDYPEPLCLFFTGCHGEKMWDRVNHDHPDPFVRRDSSSLSFCEFRLIKGLFQCPIPFWGVRHSQELRAITEADFMKPWYMGKDYDKPIARRILEEAGVPGKAFGTIKKNTATNRVFYWPYSAESQSSFQKYLKERGIFSFPGPLASLMHLFCLSIHLFYKNILVKFRLRLKFQPWRSVQSRYLLFQWANAELKKTYQEGLDFNSIPPE